VIVDRYDDTPGHAVADDVVEALGKASEALEYVERARGHLYSFHQLMGHADFVFGDAVELLRSAGLNGAADEIDLEVVGRNVLDGRWTFQVIDEFDRCYYQEVGRRVRSLEAKEVGGRRHVYEARLKDRRRSPGVAGHERRPQSDDQSADDAPLGPQHEE